MMGQLSQNASRLASKGQPDAPLAELLVFTCITGYSGLHQHTKNQEGATA
jgi:hypothetical protein